MVNRAYFGSVDEFDEHSDIAAHQAVIWQVLAKIGTSALVRVVAVTNGGGRSPVGFVDVQPMVHQVDGMMNPTPHGIVHGLPYFRVQGGANAVILDPVAGDIGLAVFSSRDNTGVIAARAPAAPASRRKFSLSDGIYIGGVLNGAPVQYVEFGAGGIEITSPGAVSITSATLTHNGVNIGSTHTHRGVRTGTDRTGVPA